MTWTDYIVSDKNVLLGKPIIKGTRISLEFIMQLFASGWTEQQIMENYPQIKKEHIKALFLFLLDDIKDKLILNTVTEAA